MFDLVDLLVIFFVFGFVHVWDVATTCIPAMLKLGIDDKKLAWLPGLESLDGIRISMRA